MAQKSPFLDAFRQAHFGGRAQALAQLLCGLQGVEEGDQATAPKAAYWQLACVNRAGVCADTSKGAPKGVDRPKSVIFPKFVIFV